MRALFSRLLARPASREPLRPLYEHGVAAARRPHWYRGQGVPDTPTGRFDMVASIVALLLLRLEAESDGGQAGVLLTELFIDDMDGQLRQWGAGDLGVGKQVGKLVATLGGRIASLRPALAERDLVALTGFARRNLLRAPEAGEDQAGAVAARLLAQWDAIAATPAPVLLAGGGEW